MEVYFYMTPQEIVNKIDSPETPFKVYYTINEFLDNDKENDALIYLQDYFKCTEDIAIETLRLYKETIYNDYKEVVEKNKASLSPEQIAHNNAVTRELLNKPKCPTCSSTDIQKIGTGERVVSVAMLGIFSKKINKSFKCKNCGYTW